VHNNQQEEVSGPCTGKALLWLMDGYMLLTTAGISPSMGCQEHRERIFMFSLQAKHKSREVRRNEEETRDWEVRFPWDKVLPARVDALIQ